MSERDCGNWIEEARAKGGTVPAMLLLEDLEGDVAGTWYNAPLLPKV